MCLTERVVENPSHYIHWRNMWGPFDCIGRDIWPSCQCPRIRTPVFICPVLPCIHVYIQPACFTMSGSQECDCLGVCFARVTYINNQHSNICVLMQPYSFIQMKLWHQRKQSQSSENQFTIYGHFTGEAVINTNIWFIQFAPQQQFFFVKIQVSSLKQLNNPGCQKILLNTGFLLSIIDLIDSTSQLEIIHSS